MESRIVEKVWGREEIFADKEGYCGKFLIIKPGFKCSLHFHNRKSESFVCIVGKVIVEYLNDLHYTYYRTKEEYEDHLERVELDASTREAFDIVKGMPHRFWSATDEPAVLVEVSTHDDSEDCARLEESGTL